MTLNIIRGFNRTALQALAILTVAAGSAHAASWTTCGGSPIKWNSNWTNMYLSTTSFTPGGPWDARLQSAMWHWNNVKGSSFNFYVGRDTDGSHSRTNGRNEVYFANSSETGAALGVTFSRYQCYWLFGWRHGRVEADIAFNAGYAWSTAPLNYANLGSPYSFEGVALHEFGHALGLGHESNRMATMNPYYPFSGPFGFYKEWDPFGDDRIGARILYPDGTTESDIAASAFKRTGAGTSGLVSSPTWAYRGTNVTLEFTFSNLSTMYRSFDIGFYLSGDNYIHTSDRLLGMNYGAWGSAGATGTFSRTLYIPTTVAPGVYYLGFLLDPNNAVAESNNSNNIQPMPRTIRIY